jgi:uncharacterized protein with HEPN domain
MRPSRRGDEFRLADVLEATDKITAWSETSRPDDTDLFRSAVLRELGVIGEAVAHLSDSFKDAHEKVPWRKMAGLRNRLVHEYWDTKWAIIEAIIIEDLPLLAQIAAEAAKPTPEDADLPALFAAAQQVSLGDKVATPVPTHGPNLPVGFTSIGTPGSTSDSATDRLAPVPICGAWMRIARAYCVLAAGHGGHHRSVL